jgi:hypothetical protein
MLSDPCRSWPGAAADIPADSPWGGMLRAPCWWHQGVRVVTVPRRRGTFAGNPRKTWAVYAVIAGGKTERTSRDTCS